MSLLSDVRDLFSGLEQEVPLLDGRWKRYVNFDNAATTPPFKAVIDCANQAFNWYSSVHRGMGFKSQLSTRLYEHCRDLVLRFVYADPSHHTLIFCSNTTDAINRLCCSLSRNEGEVVLTTVMEHHSNLLPWRFSGRIDYVNIHPLDGSLDIEHLESKLREHAGKVKLVAVTGASNVTGFISPIREIAAITHHYGARLLVDAAQLIAHRPVSMGTPKDPECIDFLVFSGHKMYAPFGSGVLIGPRECFTKDVPFPPGGGSVDLVTMNEIVWASVPEKYEAGTPNLIGVIALSKAVQTLQSLGMENIAEHERELTGKALRLLSRIQGIKISGNMDPALSRDRVGVISFISQHVDHALLAAVLSYEYGIGVRTGCFCAHLYVAELLGLGGGKMAPYITQIRRGNYQHLPGLIRLSLGLYNTAEEIEYFAEAVEKIVTYGSQGRYSFDKRTHLYVPEKFSFDFDSVFTL